MSMHTLINASYKASLTALDAQELQKVGLTGLETLYKIRMILIAALKECKTSEDWAIPVTMINNRISEAHMTIDGILGITGKLEPRTPTPTEEHDRQEWANVAAQNKLS